MATKVIEVDRGKLTIYPCSYEDYLYAKLKAAKDGGESPFAVLTRGLPKRDDVKTDTKKRGGGGLNRGKSSPPRSRSSRRGERGRVRRG